MVSDNFVNLDNRSYLLDFIITPTFRPGQARPYWKTFHKRVNWNLDYPIPDQLLTINMGNHGIFVFTPSPPFFLDKDECSDWLQWETFSPAKHGGTGDDFKTLCVIMEQPISVSDRKKGIGAFTDHTTWIIQLAASAPAPDTVSLVIENQFKSFTKNVEKQIRDEIGKPGTPNKGKRNRRRPSNPQPASSRSDTKRDRSRSPPRRELSLQTQTTGYPYQNYTFPGQGPSAMGYPMVPVAQQQYLHFPNVQMLPNHVTPASKPDTVNM